MRPASIRGVRRHDTPCFVTPNRYTAPPARDALSSSTQPSAVRALMTLPPLKPPRPASLKSRLLDAAKWSFFGYGAALVLRLASNLIVTRLLAPDLMGLMALANVLMIGLAMACDIGIAWAALRSPRGDDPRFLNAVWSVQIARGAVVTLLAWAAALALWAGLGRAWLPEGSVFLAPQLPAMLAVVGIGGLIAGFESTRTWWARRHLTLAPLTRLELVAQATTTVFMLAWAFVSPTLWALVAGYVFSAAFKTVASHLWLPGPANHWVWDRAVVRDIVAVGKWTVLSSTLTFVIANGDRLLLGSLANATALGVYSIAFLLVNALQMAVTRVVGYAVLPALSEVVRERPGDLRRAFYRVRVRLDAMCLASAGALAPLGPAIVGLLYDPRYADAGWMLAVLSVTLLTTTLEVFDQCLIALGKPRRLALLNGVRVLALYSALPLGWVLGGLQGAVWGIAASALVNALAVWAMQASLRLFDWRHEVRLPMWFGAGVVAGAVMREVLTRI